jgi:hypothetical protein
MAKASSNTPTVTITQQALNMLRQIVGAQGWAKSISDIYTGGKLLTETLPVLDSTAWVKTPDLVAKLSKDDQTAYFAQDKAWVEKPFTFAVTPAARDTIERAFQHFASTAASAKQLGPNIYLSELIDAFKIKDAPTADEATKA